LTRENAKKETETIRYLIAQRLKTRVPDESVAAPLDHLDEDAICAFVEGRLEENESAPVITHLIACASCRQTTAQLIRLESQFNPESDPTPVESTGPMRSLLEHLASRITPSFEEDAVFAYQDPEPVQNAESVDVEKFEKPEDLERTK
jgi:hypothetical protein